jgi:hypothetical protein
MKPCSLIKANRRFGGIYTLFLWALPELRRLVDGFRPRRPGFYPRSGHVGFLVYKGTLGRVSSEYFGFPCQFKFHRILHTDPSTGAGTICQLLADVPSGLSLTSTKNNYPERSKVSQGRIPYETGRKTFQGGDYDGDIIAESWSLFGLMLSPEDGGSTFLRNVDHLPEDCTESDPVQVQQSGMEIRESNPGRQLCGHQVSLPLTCRLLRPVKFRSRHYYLPPARPPPHHTGKFLCTRFWESALSLHFARHVRGNLMVSFVLRPSYHILLTIIIMK